MGGGDLNLKKSWHPATFKNQERVWMQERKHAEEQDKINQMRKELEEERQLQELQQLQDEQGSKQRTERLDWMYGAAAAGPGSSVSEDKEDYLLGKRNVDDLLRKKRNQEHEVETERFAMRTAKPISERDIQAKIREDPLFLIKKQEQESLKAIMSNPILMKKLQSDKKSKKKSKSEHKRHRPSHRRSSEDAGHSSRRSHKKHRRDRSRD